MTAMAEQVEHADYRRFLQPQVVSRLANMELRARLVVEGFITGMHRSPYHGFSVEFAEHRQYMPGDEIKHIDWKLYGKTDRYYVKEYEEETNLKSYLLLDTSASMGFASAGHLSKLTYGSYLAAGLSYMMVRQQDAVGLGLFDNTLNTYLPPHATKAYLRHLLVALQRVTPSGVSGAGKALHQVAERIRRRGLIVVISDLFDSPTEILAALKHFRHKKNEVIVMHILDPLERSFAFGDAAVFRDLETAEEISTVPWQIRAAYQKELQEFVQRTKRSCLENQVDYVLMDTTTPFDVALVEYLSKRSRLH
jgi:uncharacterized protein (DUF58 family)